MTTLPDVSPDEIPKYTTVDVADLSDEYLEGKLGEVVDEIKGRWGSVVAARLESGVLTRRLYDAVVVRVAARVWGNEDGFREEHEGQYGFQRETLAASGYIWFSDIDERSLTGKVQSKSSGRAGTATISRQKGWR
ncbi:hypothetical protein [Microbacterium sp. K24]|uniref:hypothetical protein n=1 Tax=Microbacterium sp. K24 TaxID=2305446 RepID=UPI00109D6582|nr:hypothetical protein [Microbacterium sp. K24]